MGISWNGPDTEDTRDFVPYPEWMERSPETGEVPDLPQDER